MGQSSGLPTSFTQRPYNYPDLFVSVFEFCVAGLVAAILNYFFQRPSARRVKTSKSPIPAAPLGPIRVVPQAAPSAALNQTAAASPMPSPAQEVRAYPVIPSILVPADGERVSPPVLQPAAPAPPAAPAQPPKPAGHCSRCTGNPEPGGVQTRAAPRQRPSQPSRRSRKTCTTTLWENPCLRMMTKAGSIKNHQGADYDQLLIFLREVVWPRATRPRVPSQFVAGESPAARLCFFQNGVLERAHKGDQISRLV